MLITTFLPGVLAWQQKELEGGRERWEREQPWGGDLLQRRLRARWGSPPLLGGHFQVPFATLWTEVRGQDGEDSARPGLGNEGRGNGAAALASSLAVPP